MSTYDVDNLATLPELTENVLIHALKVRYQQSVIYVSYIKQLSSVANERRCVFLYLVITNITYVHCACMSQFLSHKIIFLREIVLDLWSWIFFTFLVPFVMHNPRCESTEVVNHFWSQLSLRVIRNSM